MSLSLNILITTPTFPPFNSGLGNAVLEQAKIMLALGCRVTIATHGERRETATRDGYCLEKFSVTGADSLITPITGEVASYRDFLLTSEFDVIFANAWQTWSTDIVLQCMSEISAKVILCSHCISTNVFFVQTPIRSLVRYLLWRPYHFKVKNYLMQLDGLVTLAQSGCDSRFDDLVMAKRAGTPTYVIPNTLAKETFRGMHNELPSFAERRQIISVGAFEWQKGHAFVLKVYAGSMAKNVLPLKIFGQKFSPYTDVLRTMATELGIADGFVSFHEGVSGAMLLREYQKSQLFLYGSLTECQPLVLLDAMQSGTPFVSRASGCIDTLPGGVAVRSVKAAIAEFDALSGNVVRWTEQSVAGRNGIQRHSHENVQERWRIALQQILIAPSRGRKMSRAMKEQS